MNPTFEKINPIPSPQYLFLCSSYLAACTVVSSPTQHYPLRPVCPVVPSPPLEANPVVLSFHSLSPSCLHAFSLPINTLQLFLSPAQTPSTPCISSPHFLFLVSGMGKTRSEGGGKIVLLQLYEAPDTPVAIMGFLCSEVWEKEGQGWTINPFHTLGASRDS